MFLIRADIELDNKFRTIPITGNVYRPLLFFSDNIIRSGLLVLDEGEILEMNKAYRNRLIKIYAYKDLDILKTFYVGREFIMAEGGSAVIGKGKITEIIGEDE